MVLAKKLKAKVSIILLSVIFLLLKLKCVLSDISEMAGD